MTTPHEEWIQRETVFDGRIIKVHTGEVRLSDGMVAYREMVEHGGGVAVVPVHDGQVILVSQFRVCVGKAVLELPAGRLEPGEAPEHRALIELEEEIGYKADQLVHVASCYCSPGFTNELDHIYLAFELIPTQQRLEADERVEIVTIPLEEIDQRLNAKEFVDAKTIIGLRELQSYWMANGGL
ncbi:MAG: NUDIX hydrolase [Candidatus Hydrogenedentota bacterium]